MSHIPKARLLHPIQFLKISALQNVELRKQCTQILRECCGLRSPPFSLGREAGAMAQLPPKVPANTMTSSHWPAFAHGFSSTMAPAPSSGLLPHSAAAAVSSQQSWVDEFLDFSAAKRGHHRRSVSDSFAFLEVSPLLDEAAVDVDFDRLDDEQLMSMFSNDVQPPSSPSGIPASSSLPSTPSDHNSINDEKPAGIYYLQALNEWEEAQSRCKTEPQTRETTPAPPEGEAPSAGEGSEHFLDPKRVKRILANRQSAQRSRVRKLQYISELERSVATLQNEVSALSPRVAFLDHQRSILTVGNSHLKQRIAALSQDKIFMDAHQEALKKEVERLRQVYHQHNLKKMAALNTEPIACTENQ